MEIDERLTRIANECRYEINEIEERITIKQFVTAIKQMLACGDFERFVQIENGNTVASQVVYIPYRQHTELELRISRLKRELDYKDNYIMDLMETNNG